MNDDESTLAQRLKAAEPQIDKLGMEISRVLDRHIGSFDPDITHNAIFCALGRSLHIAAEVAGCDPENVMRQLADQYRIDQVFNEKGKL